MKYTSKFSVIMLAALLLPVARAQNTPTVTPPRLHWTGAWACATQQIYKWDTDTYIEFHDQTVRTFVHPSIGGSILRVRLSGSVSENAIPVDSATIGIRGSNYSIKTGTIHSLTFNGRSSINIPAGSTIWSDPVSLPFDAFQDLVINLQIAEYNSGFETGHARATSSNLILDGDQTNTESVSESTGPRHIGTSYFLQGVDVLADEHTYAIAVLGDSITDGIQSTWSANHRWPDFFAARLAAAHGVSTAATFAVLNEGISGNRLLHEWTGPTVFGRLGRDVLQQPGVRFVILLEGINDINQNARNPKNLPNQIASAEEIIGAYKQLTDQIHAAGMRLIVGTLTPDKGIDGYSSQIEKDRTTVNTWIRTSKTLDGVIDFDAALRDPADPAKLLASYDSGDHIHPSDAGYKAMADAIDIRGFVRAYLPSEAIDGKSTK